MEFFISACTFTLLLGLFISPVLLIRFIQRANIKNAFLFYMFIGVVIAAVLTTLFAWWTNTSDLLLLEHYGYNMDGMNETEFYGNVLPAHLKQVKNLEKNIMGIGWPLKAILFFVCFLPYLFFVYAMTQLIKRRKKGSSL